MDPDDPERSPKPSGSSLFGSAMGDAAPYLGLGIEIAISMVFFVIVGYFADGWLGTSPWLLILGCVLGLVATGVTLWKAVLDLDARSRAKRKPDEPAEPR